MITLREAAQQALKALAGYRRHIGDTQPCDAEIALLDALAQQAEPVQEQDVEDAIEAAYWHFDARKKGLNEWAYAPQSERDAFKAEARKLVRGYFPTRQAQDTKREMLAVADAFIRGKRSAQEQAEPDHETRAEIAEQRVVQLAEERDHYRNLWQKAQQAETVRCPASHVCDCQEAGQPCALAAPKPVQKPVAWLQPKTVDGYSRPDLGYETCSKDDYGAFPVYLAPPQRKPLTEEEIRRICDAHWSLRQLVRAVERAHGIGEQP